MLRTISVNKGIAKRAEAWHDRSPMKRLRDLEAATFKLESGLLDAMRELRERDGISATEQVRRALREWLPARGITVEIPKPARRGRK